MAVKALTVFCDGACLDNGTDVGAGGWCVLLENTPQGRVVHSGGDSPTTNNRMELMAAIQALALAGGYGPVTIRLHSDSSYLINGATLWLSRWKGRQWRKADGQPVANLDLWQRLDAMITACPPVEWRWVKGHSGHPLNEIADQIAVSEARSRVRP